jgi:hypothetical protein
MVRHGSALFERGISGESCGRPSGLNRGVVLPFVRQKRSKIIFKNSECSDKQIEDLFGVSSVTTIHGQPFHELALARYKPPTLNNVTERHFDLAFHRTTAR